MSWRDAEFAAANHMVAIGVRAVRVTQGSVDRGLDVVAADAAAQVKYTQRPVGGPAIQQLAGAAAGYRFRLFYSWSGFTPAAQREASRLGIALFAMTRQGIAPANTVASQVVQELRRMHADPDGRWRRAHDQTRLRMDAWFRAFTVYQPSAQDDAGHAGLRADYSSLWTTWAEHISPAEEFLRRAIDTGDRSAAARAATDAARWLAMWESNGKRTRDAGLVRAFKEDHRNRVRAYRRAPPAYL